MHQPSPKKVNGDRTNIINRNTITALGRGKYLTRLNAFQLAVPHLRTFNEAILEPLVLTAISAEKLWRTLIKKN